MSHPQVQLRSLETLWFQVGGTVCNLACTHCLVSASPTNHTHEFMTLEEVRGHLDVAVSLGVKEYYFTGGEPFLNPEMESILELTLRYGPATVLTNGLRLKADRCRRLRQLSDASDYSLDLRVSLDGYDAGSNDPIRGAGSFDRVLEGLGHLARAGLNPVITVTEVCDGVTTAQGKQRFFGLLQGLGLDKPRLKVLPLFHIGAEAERGGCYEEWQALREGDSTNGWDHLQCSSSRMVTGRGVWVCPILVNEPTGRMGERLSDALEGFPLSFQACWTCHVQGATCRT
jgi:molybdenum cofactor biosynthesis enzyme MoaA